MHLCVRTGPHTGAHPDVDHSPRKYNIFKAQSAATMLQFSPSVSGGVRVMGFSFGSTGTAAGPELPSETILLVEDEPAVRSLFAQALRQAGYRVLEARNGAEAVTVFEGSHDEIDLLLTDIRMPFLSGSELAAKLLERKPTLRMLFISGYAAQVEIGPHSALLQKPFVRADLLRAVRGVLDRPVATA